LLGFGALKRTAGSSRSLAPAEPLPSLRDVFVRNPEAGASPDGNELVVSFPRQRQGLALNPVAARCWELMDGQASLRAIAGRIAAENNVPVAAARREVLGFAARLRRSWYALPREAWAFAHTHPGEPFSGACDEGIVEECHADALLVHRAAGAPALDPDTGSRWARVWRRLVSWRRRARAAAAFARHVRREEPLRKAAAAFDRGWNACVAGRLDESASAFQEAVDLAPQWANPHYQLGYVRLRMRRFSEAVEALARAEKLSPGFFMVREYLGLARQLAAGMLRPEAFFLYDRASSAETADPDIVIELCRRALALSPVFPSARIVLGRAYARKREYERAMDELGRAIATGPDEATLCHALFARGSIFMARGMSEQALREFEKVIQIDGSPVATRHAMARLASSESVH
jgi:tetratricopeptide (TPR) repeat protein